MRCFQYLQATSETNQFLANQHFVWGITNETTSIEFRRELAWDLILNPLLIEPMPNVIATRRQSNPLMVPIPTGFRYFFHDQEIAIESLRRSLAVKQTRP
jgi:hypothetical protein